VRGPSPYLRRFVRGWWPAHPRYDGTPPLVVDAGCGNGRNARYLAGLGCRVFAGDLAPPAGADSIRLGHDPFPVPDNSADLVLLQYVLMFLDGAARHQVVGEVLRAVAPGGHVLVELYPAKGGLAPSREDCWELMAEVDGALGHWLGARVAHMTGDRMHAVFRRPEAGRRLSRGRAGT